MSIVDEVIKAYGGVQATCTRFGYKTVQGVHIWRKRGIPYRHQIEIHREKGFDLDELRGNEKASPT